MDIFLRVGIFMALWNDELYVNCRDFFGNFVFFERAFII